MIKSSSYLIGIIISLFIYFSAFPLVGLSDPLKVGDSIPNLVGNDAVSGDRLNLMLLMSELHFKKDDRGFFIKGSDGKFQSEFKRSVLILNFFSRTCIPCIREIPVFNSIVDQYKDQDVKFLYVNIDPDITPEDVKQFVMSNRIKVPMMLCNQAEAIRKYDIDALPRIVIVGKNKRIANIITGFDDHFKSNLTEMINQLL